MRQSTEAAPGKAVPRSKGRPAGTQSVGRDMMIRKAVELLRTMPPEKISMTAVANHAGVHLTLVRYYFKSRSRLLIAVARFLAVELGDIVRETEQSVPDARERLRIRIDTMVDYYLENPFYLRLITEVIAIEKDEFAEEFTHIWVSKTMEIYRDIISKGVADGQLRPTDEFYTFFAIMGLCEQFRLGIRVFNRVGIGGGESTEEATKRYKDFVYQLVINGIGTHPAA